MLYVTVLLRTFVAICDSGSFTKAAREVNLTQSAVSLHVKRLEDQVGSRLIVRGARGVRLTEQGEVLLSVFRTLTISSSVCVRHLPCEDTKPALHGATLRMSHPRDERRSWEA